MSVWFASTLEYILHNVLGIRRRVVLLPVPSNERGSKKTFRKVGGRFFECNTRDQKKRCYCISDSTAGTLLRFLLLALMMCNKNDPRTDDKTATRHEC